MARNDLNEPFILEAHERFAHGGAADAEVRRKLEFQNLLSGRVAIVQDPASDL
jgi:hypothetical protein